MTDFLRSDFRLGLGRLYALGYEEVTISGGVAVLTPPAGTLVSEVLYEGAVRVTLHDGGVPTSNFGLPRFDRDTDILVGTNEITRWRSTRQGSTNGLARVLHRGVP